MPAQLHFALLGEPQLLYNGAPLTGFISAKAQALLFYLAATGRAHSRDTLATLFWDEMPESAAKKNLTKALSNLRKLIGDLLQADNQSASLTWTSEIYVDLHLFEQVANGADPELSALQEAVDQYRHDLLAGFLVKDAPVFEEWLWNERERLHQLALRSLHMLAERLAAAQNEAQAIPYLTRLLTLEPLHEGAHMQLMLCLARTGQRSAALAQYDACCRLLAAELGTEPSAEFRACYQRIKAAGAPPPHNLPALALFVGREIELTELRQLLEQPTCRHLTIVGPGGIGKTRLALQVAGSYTDPAFAAAARVSFADGVYFVPLEAHHSRDAMLASMADTLGFAFQGAESPRQQLFNYLRQKQMLLVLDNFEQLLTAPTTLGGTHYSTPSTDCVSLLSALLNAAPGLKLLITSRVRLGVQSEHVLHLAGMEAPGSSVDLSQAALAPLTVSNALEYGSVQLFVQSACRLRPTFELTASNVDHVVQICQRVQGMPLGILLAASWISLLTPADILAELQNSLDLLETTEHGIPRRQRSVRAAFDYTWNMLAPREQEIFIKLSLFHGAFTHQAVQHVTGVSLRELLNMVDKSLLTPAQERRFVLHGLLRQFGEEKLAEAPALAQATRDRHAAYFTNQVAHYAEAFTGAEQRSALLAMELDGENVRAAWQWAVARNQIPQLTRAVDGIAQFYVWRGRFREGNALITAASTGVTVDSAPADPASPRYIERWLLQIELLIWQAVFARYLGQRDDAIQLLNKALALLSEPQAAAVDVRQVRAFALLHMGETLREGDRAAARRCYDESLTLYRAAGNRWGAANALTALGWLVQHWGAYDEARRLYQEGLTIRQQLGDLRGAAVSLRSVGGVALYQGDLAQAEQLIRESIEMAQRKGDRVGVAASLGKLGEVRIGLGQLAAAREPLQEACTIYLNLGMAEPCAFIQAIEALARLHLGQYAQAQEQARRVLTHFRAGHAQRGVAYALLVLGWSTLTSDAATAHTHLTECAEIYAELGQRDELGQAHALLGLAAHRLGDDAEAHAHLQQAAEIAQSIQAYMPYILAQLGRAHIASAQQQPTIAAAYFDPIAQEPLVTASQWAISLASSLLDVKHVNAQHVDAQHEAASHDDLTADASASLAASAVRMVAPQDNDSGRASARDDMPQPKVVALKERLVQARRTQFVGRTAERTLMHQALHADELPFNILQIYGPGGVGKTTLLHEFARLARDAGWTAIQMDARNIDPSPPVFEGALRAALGVAPAQAPAWPQLLAARGPHLFLIDTAELLTPLDGWLRDEFLPQLPATMLTVFASRKPPAVEWRSDPGWQPFVRFVPLGNLEPTESADYLARRQIPVEQHPAILDFTHGHPLALSLFADLHGHHSGVAFRPESAPDLIAALVERFVDHVPSPVHRMGLEACAMVRLLDERLLAAIIGDEATLVFAWLRSLSFMDADEGGLFPHDLARETICADLRWRNRARYADLHGRARAYYMREFLQSVNAPKQQRILHEYIFLHRNSPVLSSFFAWQENTSVFADLAAPDEHEEIVDLVEQHEGQESARLAAHWSTHPASQTIVFRDASGRVEGFLMLLALEKLDAGERQLDPAATAAWGMLEKAAPLQSDERATLFRFWMARSTYQRVSPVQSRIFVAMVQHYLSTPRLAHTFLPCAQPEFWRGIFAHADMHRLEAADFAVDERRYGVFGHDWRVMGPFPWLSLFAEREIAAGLPHAQLDLKMDVSTLSEAEFAQAVGDALRTLHDANALRTNPLLRSHLVVQRAGANGDEAARLAALRTLLRQAAEPLQQTPRQNKLFRALHHTYFQPAATQEQAAELLDVPFSTYRRHLRAGIEHVAQALWAQASSHEG
ncbi:MAG: tetratricopeptide repeat protein [Caldilineaceae bacterium]|nr:tetratricopeptide repeat protein [Caldilineaceae bacterium]